MSKFWKGCVATLVATALIFGIIALWVFVWGSAGFDTAAHSALMYLRSGFADVIFKIFTTLANKYFVVAFVIVSLLWMRNRNKSNYKCLIKKESLNNAVNHIMPWLIFGLSVAVLSAAFLGIKAGFGRPRPIEWFLVTETGYSFPSGHTATALTMYGLLAYMISTSTNKMWIKSLSYSLASVIVLMVGLSRIYLGVHYATDVLAGAALGGFFLIIGIMCCKWFGAKIDLKSKDRQIGVKN